MRVPLDVQFSKTANKSDNCNAYLGASLSWNNGDGHTVREMTTAQVGHFNGVNLSVSQITLVGIVTAITVVAPIPKTNPMTSSNSLVLFLFQSSLKNRIRYFLKLDFIYFNLVLKVIQTLFSVGFSSVKCVTELG